MFCLYILFILSSVWSVVRASVFTVDHTRAFDQDLYKSVLDEEQCRSQLRFLSNNSLGLQFLDASGRIPSGILGFHLADMGDYHRCLKIEEIVNDLDIRGKYCSIRVPLNQNPIEIPEWPEVPEPPEWPDIPWPEIPPWPRPDNRTERDVYRYLAVRRYARLAAGAGEPIGPLEPSGEVQPTIFPGFSISAGLALAVCVPRVCTPTQAIDFFQNQIPFLNFTFTEHYCRLPNDKPFAPADYVAIVIFSLLAFIILISTSYDLHQVFVAKKVSSEVNALYSSFSVYTNTRRLLTFKPVPGALECVDGIRTISMLWVIVGHTYSMTLLAHIHNLKDIVTWISTLSAAWVSSAPITVDTFFLLSGVLCVYSTVGKLSRGRFVRSLHLFYLHRLLRMFPLLAAVVLLQASLFLHLADGPYWQNVAQATMSCRRYWWSALLHVQNYVNPLELCLYQSWYLSVDVQLYLVCPLVLFWLFGPGMFAWCSLASATVLSLVATTAYSFIYNFSASLNNPTRILEFHDYVQLYYLNTLTRASPFCVGMVYGYLLNKYRLRKIRIPTIFANVLWATAFVTMAFCIFSIYPVNQPEHSAQSFDNFLNAYMRALWAAAVGWVIFGCVQGYGGAVNWFLSLKMWKLPARLSYAVYLIHLPIIILINGTWMKTHYFGPGEALYRNMAELVISFIAAFILCIAIDAPFSTLQKMVMGAGKKPVKRNVTESRTSHVADERYNKTTL